ncbi:DUF397 domain-containing protein [Streptomyces sp. TRM70350]|uniref:DUF397 domain-containing protein n=1 Tax=Streptomyces sp. TRM70350 TaxID=2856165 RepID=UPI001C46FCEE|nr:DUF397 domain-containing protein [Streptomyces sp. TRM70350]MBV7698455.1 DUF397 domain-containing protein [Streptomyces sp. TRM70350]
MASNAVPTVAQWRKSSYSSDQGGQCVECAPIGLTWRKSTYSGDQGGECIEIAEAPCATIAIRDSKTPTGPLLTVAPAAFTTFVSWSAATTAE